MGIWKRKTRREGLPGGAFGRLMGWVSVQELRLAGYLNRKTAGFSSQCWMYLLIAFCAVTGGYLLSLLLDLFNH